jgi:hypothetical protein
MAANPSSRPGAATEPDRQADDESIGAVASSLRDLFGEHVTARIANAEAASVADWIAGGQQPSPDAAQRLLAAWRVAEHLLREEDRETVRAWFLGVNPELGDRVPALTVGDDPEGVLRAARTFVAYG